MASSSTSPRYRAVDANGIFETTSSTDDEMIDITSELPNEYPEYTDLADKSQGK